MLTLIAKLTLRRLPALASFSILNNPSNANPANWRLALPSFDEVMKMLTLPFRLAALAFVLRGISLKRLANVCWLHVEPLRYCHDSYALDVKLARSLCF